MEHTEHQEFASTAPIPVVTPIAPQGPEPTQVPELPKRRKSQAPMLVLGIAIILGVLLIVVGLLSTHQTPAPSEPSTEVPITVETPTSAPSPTPQSPQAVSARQKLDALGASLGEIDPYDPSLSLPAAQSSLGF